MESSLIANALQVNFDSVLGIPDDEGMVMMFRALVAAGISGFLGCPSVLYEQELEQFFDTTFVKDNEIICAVQGKFVGVSKELFAGVFELPTTGLTDVDDVPKDLVYDARSIFSKSGEPVQTSCKKRKMKHEFHLLNDILAKSVTVKAGSFDAVTHERFLLMTCRRDEEGVGGLDVPWRNLDQDYLAGTYAWLQPVLQESGSSRLIAVDYRQSGPRPDPRLLRQAALEALTRSARTNTPLKTRPEQFPAKIVVGGGGGAWAAAAAS
ncbi:hypothetical protein F511_28662 [Dorcoceras hygrometricum]|uniref:Uncharacterized protein n=1 Tax=Dorcoceras hygrometricum TaxID=472368 RepID=A0A2Z7C3F2_9LAMI|nr:hypothetical protein F511_28662 [Dorcoceras hygrometricum]